MVEEDRLSCGLVEGEGGGCSRREEEEQVASSREVKEAALRLVPSEAMVGELPRV